MLRTVIFLEMTKFNIFMKTKTSFQWSALYEKTGSWQAYSIKKADSSIVFVHHIRWEPENDKRASFPPGMKEEET